MAHIDGIRLKKRYGQHFLQDQHIVDHMIDAVDLNDTSSVFEIGCGEGFLTRTILQTKTARLWVFEIDEQWADYVAKECADPRLSIFTTNFLDVDLHMLKKHAPWTVLANLPYQVTFPILHRFHKYREYLAEGVVMIQEEVAQKLVKQSGRGYGYVSLFFQHYFELKLLDKIAPESFYPPPKVFSRLLYFKPKCNVKPIEKEEKFWRFIKQSFLSPRRTLYNNLKAAQIDDTAISKETLKLRAQQMSMQDFLDLWTVVSKQF